MLEIVTTDLTFFLGIPIVVKVVFRRGMSSGMTKLEFHQPLKWDLETFFKIMLVQQQTVMNFLSDGGALDSVILSSFVFWIRSSHESLESIRDVEASAIILALSMEKVNKSNLSQKFSDKIYELGKMIRDLKNRFDIDVVNALANFQGVLYHATLLNKLLGQPFPEPMSMNQWWNGTLMYNLASGFLFGSEKDLRENLITLDAGVFKAYIDTWNFVTGNIPEMANLRRDAEKKRRTKKKKCSNNHNCLDQPLTDLASTESPSDLSNRFSILQSA